METGAAQPGQPAASPAEVVGSTLGQLPDDVLALVFQAALPCVDADGYLPSRAVAQLCAIASCCKSWRRSLQRSLSSQQGLWLACAGSERELAWLHSPWLRLAAVKFTYLDDRQAALAWEWQHRRGYAASMGTAVAQEEGLEARRRGSLEGGGSVLEALPPRLPELLLDFPDSAIDLAWAPQRRVSRLRHLRLRSPTDCFLGPRELAAAVAATEALTIEASGVQLTVGLMTGERDGTAAGRLQTALRLVGDAVAMAGLSQLRLQFKDVALLQVSPACTIRVSMGQLMQRAGVERAESGTDEGGSLQVAIASLPGRQWWFRLEAAPAEGE